MQRNMTEEVHETTIIGYANSYTEEIPKEPYSSNMKRKIFVAGSTQGNSVALQLIQRLLRNGYSVVRFVDSSQVSNELRPSYDVSLDTDRFDSNSFSLYKGSIRNTTLIRKIFEEEHIDQICHLITIDETNNDNKPFDDVQSDNAEDIFEAIDTNIQSTVTLLSLAVEYNLTDRNFVLASNAVVYGNEPLMANMNTNAIDAVFTLSERNKADQPLSVHAASIKSMELFGHTWHYLYNLPFTALRFFDIGNHLDRLPSSFNDVTPTSDLRSYTTLNDTVNAIYSALEYKQEQNTFDVINIASTTETNHRNTKINLTAAHEILGFTELDSMDFSHSRRKQRSRRLRSAFPQQSFSQVSLNDTTDFEVAPYSPVIDANIKSSQNVPFRTVQGRRRLMSDVQNLDRVLENNSVDWSSSPVVQPHTGSKIVLVTGAAGFIGSHVADKLLERGDTVIIIDELNDYYDVSLKHSNLKYLRDKYENTGALKIYIGDIANITIVEEIFEKEHPEWICHMAARAGVRPSIVNPDLYIHSNIRGTVQLLEMARKYEINNFVFASSSSVYGGSSSTLFSESETVDYPISPYAASKRTCELISWTYHHLYRIPVTALRFFTVYGPRGRPDMAPFQFIDRISRGESINQYGDGRSSRDYTYVDDIVNGVVRSLDRPYEFQIFNLGKGSGTSLLDFIKFVQVYTGRKASIKILPDQPGDVPYTCADVSKAKHFLGYESSVTFEDGMKRTIEWYNETYLEEQEHFDDSKQQIYLAQKAPIELVKHPVYTSSELLEDFANIHNFSLSSTSYQNSASYSGVEKDCRFSVSIFYIMFFQWIVIFVFAVVRSDCKVIAKFRKNQRTASLTSGNLTTKRAGSNLEEPEIIVESWRN